MDYIPEHNLVACACAKCGSTAMVTFLYQQLFGQPWPHPMSNMHKDIHNIYLPEWGKAWKVIWDLDQQKEIMKKAFSFALVRDPMERLISSWKSKLQCTAGPHKSDPGRDSYVLQLQKLHGGLGNGTCMSLENFALALFEIHQRGDAKYLNNHFLPQNMGCFNDFPPGNWSKVIHLGHPDTFSTLGAQIGSKAKSFPSPHSSQGVIRVSERAFDLLVAVTAQEYQMLGEYLPPSRVAPGNYV